MKYLLLLLCSSLCAVEVYVQPQVQQNGYSEQRDQIVYVNGQQYIISNGVAYPVRSNRCWDDMPNNEYHRNQNSNQKSIPLVTVNGVPVVTLDSK